MLVRKTEISEVLVIELPVFEDPRGFFFESFNSKIFAEAGISGIFVQDNQSFSKHGVLRGLHYQKGSSAQAKIVRVLSGNVIDIVVDIRKGSPTFGKWVSEELSGENRRQLYIPRGFAHGFAVISETAEFFYKCDNYYSRESEAGIRFDDPDLDIDWKIDRAGLIISEKDLALPFLKDAVL
ncbi:MAG: dTDP-4-dehydrorhamnose 3,5-epimerase [Brevinematales bacterium]